MRKAVASRMKKINFSKYILKTFLAIWKASFLRAGVYPEKARVENETEEVCYSY